LLAEALFRQNKFDQSIETAQKFSEKFADFEYWLGRAFILIADNYAAKNELFQAEATLNSIIENSPLPEIVDMAKAKKAGLQVPQPTPQQEETSKRIRLRNTAQKDTLR
jgi:hypothetical protein